MRRGVIGRTRFTAVAVLASVTTLVGAACGGSDALPTYFEDLEAIFEDAVAGTDALAEEFSQLEGAQAFAALPDFYSRSGTLYGDMADRVAELEPPSAVELAHPEVQAAISGVAEAYESLIDRVAQVESATDLEAVVATLAVELRLGLFEAACVALERIAADNDIAVELPCEDEQGSV